MSNTLQTILVLAAVIAAVAWLVTGRLRRRRAGSKCDHCGLAEAVRTTKSSKSS
ncbi:MAG: FeoB-associated Cys-rich membrane protein [Candidatus Krumholzibacteria bacterium]|nr:FeoB-associated Cys-rich membrane protein [Candidatus Krumholzibacteria bacterium]MDH4335989.1 FeoB-associated Cys-rich membrane protein [Candidatus Krumholzibacteria bacterium]MDH5268435.1 FeoB-associated Cys-rich membrane protein [Candidatus Krumholzibacteria bacterium]MDH5626942.1 FeoB-associated Cys-rich membrane protein [Candidatus Krumholzibacteria bacterium]